jgi:hypothetical protein
MKASNRDLLVLSKKVSMDPLELEHEVELLHELLYHVESLPNFCTCTEIVDINRYKIIRKPHLIEQVIREKSLKAFQFLFNRN